ncbi:MAG: serine hydrolase domain-containing protein, partial [Chloroflexota bacterium]
MADWTRQIHNTAETEFPFPFVGNVEFATAAILQLEQAGKLHDADKICTYIPHCPAAWAPITVHELLTSSTGILDYVNTPPAGFSFDESFTLRALVDRLGALPLRHKPGVRFPSTAEAPIEEYLVERISGESFAEYVQRHLLGPLGLMHTGYFPHFLTSRQYATSYKSWQV